MLSHLIIRNFAIIEHLEIPFHKGFTVLTGETGAGKSIIIDALNLLLGGRATTEVVRTDEKQAVVEGIFELGARKMTVLNSRLEERGITIFEEQLVVRRLVARSGRNKVFVNGSLTTVASLAKLMRGLVDISGQHEHYSLLDPDGHVDILDAFANLGSQRLEMSVSYQEVLRLRREIAALKKDGRDRLNRIDFLRFQLDEIKSAALDPDEESVLGEELGRLQHAEKLQDAGLQALHNIYEGDNSAAWQLSKAAGILARVSMHDAKIAKMADQLASVHIMTEEIVRDLRSHMLTIESDPRRLDELIERGEELKKLKRKHGTTVQEILVHADKMSKELNNLINSEERSQDLEQELAAAERIAYEVAHGLSQARRAAAVRMERAIEVELEDLNMARTKFVVQFEPALLPDVHALLMRSTAEEEAEEKDAYHVRPKLTERGFDGVEFLISPNLGESPKSLSKIASGGELSRIMLIMKSVLAERDEVETYVFDEVDTGIGGSTADMVGHKIEQTGKNHQVLCITHLPQIASRGDHHYLVEKVLQEERTQSTIRPLEDGERVEEIARMLSGTRVTSTTLAAAKEMVFGRYVRVAS